MPPFTALCSPLLSEHGFRHGFSPRQGGVSEGPYAGCNVGHAVGDRPEHVAQNRERFAAAIGYVPDDLFEISQVHGRVVRCLEGGDDPAAVRAEDGDGLVALGQGLRAGQGRSEHAVGVRTADCVPLLLADPVTRAVAAVHAGWRGTALDIAGEGVRLLCARSGAAPARLIAAVFPHIRACCFEVSADVAATLEAAARNDPRSRSGSVVARRALAALPGQSGLPAPDPKPHVDLLAIVRAQLLSAGVSDARIDVVEGCTRCEPERFFSYRRDGQRSGRHLTAIIAG